MNPATMDTIHITDIRAYGYTGALPEETVLGQWFRVDLILWLDLSQASTTDALPDTHDYRRAIAATQTLIRERTYKLVEALAGEIARLILQLDHRLAQVQVKLTKVAPPIPEFGGQIAVEITRDRTYLDRPSTSHLSASSLQPTS